MIHSTNENRCSLVWLSAVLPFEGLQLFNVIFCSKCQVWSFTCRDESISAAPQQGLDSRGGTNLYVNEGSAGAPRGLLYYFKRCFEILIWHSSEAAFIKRVMSSGSLPESEAWVLLDFWCFDPSRKHCQAVTINKWEWMSWKWRHCLYIQIPLFEHSYVENVPVNVISWVACN